MTVRLSSKLPPLEGNGLAPLEEALVIAPKERRIAIVVLDVDYRYDPHADGILEPRARIVQIEVLQGEPADEGRELLTDAYRRRTGATTLPDLDADNPYSDVDLSGGDE